MCRPVWLLAAVVLTAGARCSSAQANAAEMSEAARTYLTGVLDKMEKGALNRDSIDWKRVRAETFALAGGAQTTADTYVAVAHAIGELKERHSFLMLPDSLDKDRKQAIQREMGVELAKVRGAPRASRGRSPFAAREMSGHIDRRDGKIFAHVVVPHCSAQYSEWEKNIPYFQEFTKKLKGIVADLMAQKPDGWLVDLRGNGGGNMWPMLAGITAILGEGDLGSFRSPDGGGSTWFLKDGTVSTRPGVAGSVQSPTPGPFFSPADLPWLAVLFDRGTASSGEAVAISFAGRPRSRSFGEHTAGFSTANQNVALPDGAMLLLCSSVEADRTGRLYPDGLDPGVSIPTPESLPAEDADAVIQAAEEWILSAVAGRGTGQ
jgi:carboxyl-terminal processing protease